MDRFKKELQGSDSRDVFKRFHKELASNFYGADLDFMMVSKQPPGIVAFTDYKKPWDIVTFSEVIAYNTLSMVASIYIIEAANPQTGPFTIRQYKAGDWRPWPPKVELEDVTVCENWKRLGEWESELRQSYARNHLLR